MANFKYYVVWEGYAPGIYDSWEECKQQIEGYSGAKYKSFTTKEAAVKAFRDNYDDHIGALKAIAKHINEEGGEGCMPEYNEEARAAREAEPKHQQKPRQLPPSVIPESLAVDAACSGNPGPMEYRGVYVRTGKEVFRVGPFDDGTNNIGEFLALVHGLALLKQKGLTMPIYTDSVNAMSWVRQKKCKTKIERTPRNTKIFELIERAERWLAANSYATPIFKWDTKTWGEIPADFGRK